MDAPTIGGDMDIEPLFSASDAIPSVKSKIIAMAVWFLVVSDEDKKKKTIGVAFVSLKEYGELAVIYEMMHYVYLIIVNGRDGADLSLERDGKVEFKDNEVTAGVKVSMTREDSKDIFSFGSALEDFICVVFVLDRNIMIATMSKRLAEVEKKIPGPP
ncbi:hypothetical protein Tco_0366860 [Tanacetum coccineum]